MPDSAQSMIFRRDLMVLKADKRIFTYLEAYITLHPHVRE
jgi:hypothetical protein